MSEDSSRCTLWWKLSSSCGCYECFPISYMFLGPHMKLLIHSPWFTWATSTRQAGGSHVRRIGLSVPLPFLLANALLYLGHFILQVHFHWHLHFWVIDKNIGERILYDRIHLPSRSVELAGFQCYCYGVSSTPLYFSRQRYAIELFKKMSGCSLFFHSNCTGNKKLLKSVRMEFVFLSGFRGRGQKNSRFCSLNSLDYFEEIIWSLCAPQRKLFVKCM